MDKWLMDLRPGELARLGDGPFMNTLIWNDGGQLVVADEVSSGVYRVSANQEVAGNASPFTTISLMGKFDQLEAMV